MCSIFPKLVLSIAGDVVRTDMPPFQNRMQDSRRRVDIDNAHKLGGEGFLVNIFVFISPVDRRRGRRAFYDANDLEDVACVARVAQL